MKFSLNNPPPERQDHSITVDQINHRFDVPVKACFHSICTLLDLLSILNTHYSLSPSLPLSLYVGLSQCVSPSLHFSFPLVVSAIIIPLFFEVFVKSKAPKQCQYTALLSI